MSDPAPDVEILEFNLAGPVLAVRPCPYRPLLAGLFRHQPADSRSLWRSGIAGPGAAFLTSLHRHGSPSILNSNVDRLWLSNPRALSPVHAGRSDQEMVGVSRGYVVLVVDPDFRVPGRSGDTEERDSNLGQDCQERRGYSFPESTPVR